MDLDDELRRMFANVGDQLDVPVRGDAEQTIVAGAGRRRKRRMAAVGASGAAAVAVLVAAGIALANPTPQSMPPALVPPTTSSTSSEPPSSTSVTTIPTEATPPPVAPPPQTLEETETSVEEPPPPEATGEQLGPIGFRALRMNMTLDEANATGMIGTIDTPIPPEGCAQYPLVVDGTEAGFAYFTQASGLIIIAPDVPVHTVDGVSIGWSLEQIEQVRPDFDVEGANHIGRGYLLVEGHAGWRYRLGLGSDYTVKEIALQPTNDGCYE